MPVVTRLTRAERQARTIEELLDAAGAEFDAVGYHAATVEEIAARAGYTRGAVYGNFPAGKSDLFLAVAERRAQAYVGRITEALDGLGDGRIDEAELARAYVGLRSRTRDGGAWGRAQVEFALVAATDPDLRRRYGALRAATIARVEAGFAPLLTAAGPVDARELATVAVALEQGLDLLRGLDPSLVATDLEYRVIARLGPWIGTDGDEGRGVDGGAGRGAAT